MADGKNQFGLTEAGESFGTVYMVRDDAGNYRCTSFEDIKPGEIPLQRGTCWRGEDAATSATAMTLLDRAGVVNGRKRW
jgi:hypothetical protein